MPELTGKIHVITVKNGENLWNVACAKVAESWSDRLLDPPLWIVPDERHRETALLAMMREMNVQAIPTGNVCTLISLAGDILGIPVLDLFARAHLAILTLKEIFSQNQLEPYIASCDTPGFAESFWVSMEDAESRGYFPDETLSNAEGAPPPDRFVDLQCLFHKKLAETNRFTAGEILRRACLKLMQNDTSYKVASPLFIGPFFNPNPLEKAFIAALLTRVDQAYVIPASGSSWHGDFTSGKIPVNRLSIPTADILMMHPRTPEVELDSIFSQIAELVANKEFHYYDFRIISPNLREVFPQIVSAAGRYRVPLRAEISRPLEGFYGVVLLVKLLDLFDKSWGRKEILEVLRSRIMHAPPLETSRVIKGILTEGKNQSNPSGTSWVAMAASKGADQVAFTLEQLHNLDVSSRGKQTGSSFSAAVRNCIKLLKEEENKWKDLSPDYFKENPTDDNAWKALDLLLNDFTLHFTEKVDRSKLLETFKRAVWSCNYVPINHTIDAVDICPNTREDHLPIPLIYYHSLHFRVPSPSRSSPFLKDETRIDYPQQFHLFQQLTGNAQKRLLLSCPRYDDNGNELAASPFLSSLKSWLPSKPEPMNIVPWKPGITDHASRFTSHLMLKKTGKIRIKGNRALNYIRGKNLRWSPTQLGHALQCPYLHFAFDILGLRQLSDTISEGVTSAILGSLAHKAIEKFISNKIDNRAFDIEKWVRDEFHRRTELFDPHPEMDRALEELMSCLVDFVERGWAILCDDFHPAEPELHFGKGGKVPGLNLELSVGNIQLKGQIDRIDESQDGRVLITEYKYQEANSHSKTEFFDNIYQGQIPQLPLYGLVARDVLGKRPVALLQIYLRSAVIRGVRTEEIENPPVNMNRGSEIRIIDQEGMNQIFNTAVKKLDEMAVRISEGDIQPVPSDFNRCGPGKCEYSDLCRFRQRWKT